MLRQKYAAPGLVQRMHRMQAEVAEPLKPWEIAKAGQEVSLNQSRVPARHINKPWVKGVTNCIQHGLQTNKLSAQLLDKSRAVVAT